MSRCKDLGVPIYPVRRRLSGLELLRTVSLTPTAERFRIQIRLHQIGADLAQKI
jgi:DNA-binding IclR family transcriptional regulator